MEEGKIISFEKRKKEKESRAKRNYILNVGPKPVDGSIHVDKDTKVYTNPFFGLEIKVPVHWVTLDHHDLVGVIQDNFNRLPLTEEDKNKMVEAINTNSPSLFSATPFPKGTKQPYGKQQKIDNPAIYCTAQKITMYSDFIQELFENFKKGRLGFMYEEVSPVHTTVINGKRFDTIEGRAFINKGRDMVYTRYYSIFKKGYQLSIITNSISDEGAEDLMNIVRNLSFKG